MLIMILDDEDYRHVVLNRKLAGNDIVNVYSFVQAVAALSDLPFDVLCLDHDLACEDDVHTGYDLCLFIKNKLPKDKYPKQVIIHSMNPVGAYNMDQALQNLGFPVEVHPFHDLVQKL